MCVGISKTLAPGRGQGAAFGHDQVLRPEEGSLERGKRGGPAGWEDPGAGSSEEADSVPAGLM